MYTKKYLFQDIKRRVTYTCISPLQLEQEHRVLQLAVSLCQSENRIDNTDSLYCQLSRVYTDMGMYERAKEALSHVSEVTDGSLTKEYTQLAFTKIKLFLAMEEVKQ